MPVILIVILVILVVGALSVVAIPAIVADPVPPSPPPPTELRAPEIPGVAVDSTKVVVSPVIFEEDPAESGAAVEDANPYDAILDDAWSPDASLEFDEPFEPDSEPLIEESSRTRGMAGRLGGL